MTTFVESVFRLQRLTWLGALLPLYPLHLSSQQEVLLRDVLDTQGWASFLCDVIHIPPPKKNTAPQSLCAPPPNPPPAPPRPPGPDAVNQIQGSFRSQNKRPQHIVTTLNRRHAAKLRRRHRFRRRCFRRDHKNPTYLSFTVFCIRHC